VDPGGVGGHAHSVEEPHQLGVPLVCVCVCVCVCERERERERERREKEERERCERLGLLTLNTRSLRTIY
jgi:hypothetical protein